MRHQGSGINIDRVNSIRVAKPLIFISVLRAVVSVTLSYFILAVPIRKCSGKHSGMSSSILIAILNGTCSFPTVQLQVHNVYSEKYKIKLKIVKIFFK